MTKADRGRYSEKHRGERSVSSALGAAIRAGLKEEGVPCGHAEGVARELDVTMQEVGKAIDLMEIRINRCQLGLFGYRPERKIVQAAPEVSAELEQAIRAALEDGRLSCLRAWEIAVRFELPRMGVSAACETLDIKIGPCQLGAF